MSTLQREPLTLTLTLTLTVTLTLTCHGVTTRSVNSLHKLSGIFRHRCCALSAAMSSKPNWSRMG